MWDKQIFLTSVEPSSGDLLLLCVGTDGKEQWRQKVATGSKNVRNDEGNYASPSPATDGTAVGNTDEVAVLPPVSGGCA